MQQLCAVIVKSKAHALVSVESTSSTSPGDTYVPGVDYVVRTKEWTESEPFKNGVYSPSTPH